MISQIRVTFRRFFQIVSDYEQGMAFLFLFVIESWFKVANNKTL